MSENFLTSDDQFHFNCELKTKRSAFYSIYIYNNKNIYKKRMADNKEN